jgi:hypothetical protein
MAHARGRKLDHDVAWPGLRHGQLVDPQRLAEGMDDGSAHFIRHRLAPLLSAAPSLG